MEEKKRKVVTYHSTISNKKLERELNEGYHIEFCHPLRSYLVMVLRKDEKTEITPEYSFYGKDRQIMDYVIIDVSDKNPNAETEKNSLFEKGYEVYRLTTKNCIMVKYKE